VYDGMRLLIVTASDWSGGIDQRGGAGSAHSAAWLNVPQSKNTERLRIMSVSGLYLEMPEIKACESQKLDCIHIRLLDPANDRIVELKWRDKCLNAAGSRRSLTRAARAYSVLVE